LGGSSGGIRTEYGPKDVDRVTLTFVQQPTSTTRNAFINSQLDPPGVKILATASLVGGGTGSVPNVSITVDAVNSNGTPATLNGTTTQITDGNGIATYTNLSETKPGSYRLITVDAKVLGRLEIPVDPATSVKFNVAPK
jgi:hypothetical protein